MPDPLEPVREIKCTYEDCSASFKTEKEMKLHKKRADEHDYCGRCDEDFDSYDELARHKILRPDKHSMACRVCGEEYKSTSGLRSHIQAAHKIDQKLSCLGCGEDFHRASLLVEHLEFGSCEVISAEQFMGHIVHKNLINELLKGGAAFNRFMQKISKFDATLDYDEEGGVGIEHVLDADDDKAREVEYDALKPEVTNQGVASQEVPYTGHYPPLAIQSRSDAGASDLTLGLRRMSLAGSESDTVISSAGSKMGPPVSEASTSQHTPWTRNATKELFPQAKPTPPVSEFTVESHDEQMDSQHGINILKTRFWDPEDEDWNAERFYNGVIQRYFCPFVCEQSFDNVRQMREHIKDIHRVTRVKCPYCLKYFRSVTALMCHCESRGSKCQINKTDDFNIFLDKLTGGFLSVEEKTRPDHLHNPSAWITNQETGCMEKYTPPTATYLQYTASKPVGWKEPKKVAAQIGGGGTSGTFNYKGKQARW